MSLVVNSPLMSLLAIHMSSVCFAQDWPTLLLLTALTRLEYLDGRYRPAWSVNLKQDLVLSVIRSPFFEKWSQPVRFHFTLLQAWERCVPRRDYRTHDSWNPDFLSNNQALSISGHPGAHQSSFTSHSQMDSSSLSPFTPHQVYLGAAASAFVSVLFIHCISLRSRS